MNDEVRNTGRSAMKASVRTEHQRTEGVREPVRKRTRKNQQTIDKFHVDPSSIPAGISYEWKRIEVLGQGDPSYDTHMREQGWEPVDSARHPELVAAGHKGAIVRDGLMLMERPIELTTEARQEDYAAAREAIEIREQQMRETPKGTLTRDHATARPKIGRSYEPIAVPDD